MQPISTLNALPRVEFAAALRPLFEAAEPLADALYARRPFASYAELIDSAERLTRDMSFDERVQTLAAHPRIGANPETVSATSFAEQGYQAESAMDPAELAGVYDRLAALNRAYEEQFGFRFVVFVNRRPKAAIVEVLEQRLQRPRDEELQTGLRELFRIARDRLISLSSAEGQIGQSRRTDC